MATWFLSLIIFGSAGWIVYKKLKNGGSCEECQTACPVKTKQQIKQ